MPSQSLRSGLACCAATRADEPLRTAAAAHTAMAPRAAAGVPFILIASVATEIQPPSSPSDFPDGLHSVRSVASVVVCLLLLFFDHDLRQRLGAQAEVPGSARKLVGLQQIRDDVDVGARVQAAGVVF